MKKLIILFCLILIFAGSAYAEDINIDSNNYDTYFTNTGTQNINDGDTITFSESILRRQYRFLRKERVYLCQPVRHPLSRSAGRHGRVVLPVPRADPGVPGRGHGCVRAAGRLLRRGKRSGRLRTVRRGVPSDGEKETARPAGLKA